MFPSHQHLIGSQAKCPICLDVWTATGEHRIVCLACGHLFGRSCIVQWLKVRSVACASRSKTSSVTITRGSNCTVLQSRRAQGGTCPQCGERARPSDVRAIYVPDMTVSDTSRVDELTRDLQRERHTTAKVCLQCWWVLPHFPNGAMLTVMRGAGQERAGFRKS